VSNLSDRIARFRAEDYGAHTPECHDDAIGLLDDYQKQIQDLQQQKVFEAQWADKLKEFGTIDRLIEAYSQSKMEARKSAAENRTLTQDLAACVTARDMNHSQWFAIKAEWENGKEESRKLREALDTARAALHHCDIRHKKCTCSREAIAEIDAALADKGETE